MVLKSKRNKQFAVRHLENKKLQANCNLRKIHKQFGQHNTGEQHTGRQRSDSAEPYTIGFPKSNFRTFHINHCIKLKSFSVQQFFKNAAEVWASSPHLRSKLKLHRETKQKSKKQSEESQLPLKSKGCNEIQGFRGNCDSQASWGCAPALPNRIRVVSLRAVFHMKQSKNCS